MFMHVCTFKKNMMKMLKSVLKDVMWLVDKPFGSDLTPKASYKLKFPDVYKSHNFN